MPSPLIVSIPHKLGKDEAVRRLKRGLASGKSGVPMLQIDKEEWSGDRLSFSLRAMGQTAFGSADVSDNAVTVEVVLPPMLHRFGEVAASFFRTSAQKLLEKK